MIKLPGSFPFTPLVLLIRMTWKNGGISFSRIPLFVAYIFRFLLLEPLRLLELIVYHRKIKAHKLEKPPIFILGYWRSGTSFFQGLLCEDPKLTSSTIFRSLFPDTFLLTERWIKPILNSLCKLFRLPYSIQRTKLDLDFCSEADMALMSLSSANSYTWGQLFPKRFNDWLERSILLNDKQISNEWIDDYDYFIRKISFQSKGKQVIIKSPGDTPRAEQLLKKYPNAKFIYIHRDPVGVYNSNLFFWNVLQRENCLQKISSQEIDELIIHSYREIVQRYFTTRQLVPASQLYEVQFEELIQDPFNELKRIYEALTLDPFPEKEIRALLADHKPPKTGEYEKSTALRERLKKEWPFAFEAFAKK
jgi:omega-hydroxy-beta-dihydromenaquinone-9 sulfotransferase